MSTWFYYYENNGQKQRATVEQIKELARQGVITPETIIENESGKQTSAGKIKGLTFAARPQPEAPPKIETEQDIDALDNSMAGALMQGRNWRPPDWRYNHGNPHSNTYDQDWLRHGFTYEEDPEDNVDVNENENDFTEHPTHAMLPPEMEDFDHDRLGIEVGVSSISIILYVLIWGAIIIKARIAPGAPIDLLDFSTCFLGLTGLGTIIFSIFCMVRLAKLLHFAVVLIVLMAICLPIPFLCFIPLYFVFFRAVSILAPQVESEQIPSGQNRLEMYRENADVLDGVKWRAALDSRTCLACGALDGMIWQPNQLRQIKSPPLHKDCRCLLIPYIDIGDDPEGRPAEAENFDLLAKEKYEKKYPNKNYNKLSYSYRRQLRYKEINEYARSGRQPYKRMSSGATFEQYLRGSSLEFQRLWFIQEGIYDQYWGQWINRRMTLAEIASAKASRR